MAKLIMMVGIPGCGKSTYAEKIASELDAEVYSSDKYREKIYGDENVQDDPQKVFNALHRDIKEALQSGRNCVYDATNVAAKRRTAFLKEIERIPDVKKECVVVIASPEECIRRQNERTRKVPDKVIYDMMKRFDFPMYSEGWNSIYIQNTTKNFDIETVYKKLFDVEQTSKYHLENAGRHSIMVEQKMREMTDDDEMITAARYHDTGKVYTQSIDDNGMHHFFGHEHVSAYLYALTLPSGGYTEAMLRTLTFIQYHDLIYSNEKKFNSLNTKLKEELKMIHEADQYGSITEEKLKDISLLQFITAFDDWKERISKPPYNIIVKQNGDLYLFKYNQLDSDFSLRVVQESRGSILRVNDGIPEYVCRPFDKFFNYGEAEASEIDWKSARITEKVDGCFSGDVTVLMADGKQIPFKLLPYYFEKEEQYVLTRNMRTGRIELQKINSIKISSGKNTIWQIIEFNNNKVKCTANHVFYVFKDGEVTEKTASELQYGDNVLIAKDNKYSFETLTQVYGTAAEDYKYDIEVAGNHNYFANGILVHNSLMKMYYTNDKWNLATNATINAFEAKISDSNKTFGDIFERALGYKIDELGKRLDKNCTYMFELTSPDTRVVIPYKDGVYYLSRRNTKTGEEFFDRPEIPNVKYPKTYKMNTLDDVVNAALKLGKDEEGFVVNDKYGRRIKVKGPEYLIAAKLTSNHNLSTKSLYRVIMEGKEDDLLAYAPEYTEKVNHIKQAYKEVRQDILDAWDKYKDCTIERKEFAELIKDEPHKGFIFKKRNHGDVSVDDYLSNMFEYKMLEFIKEKLPKDEITEEAPMPDDSDER